MFLYATTEEDYFVPSSTNIKLLAKILCDDRQQLVKIKPNYYFLLALPLIPLSSENFTGFELFVANVGYYSTAYKLTSQITNWNVEQKLKISVKDSLDIAHILDAIRKECLDILNKHSLYTF